ncbi:TonB-dependent receptor plug domain-containing protein [Massilia yuzhufengensis]|uniref:Iron complex outermembrane recepter protein n=1 Tax=Massilia yuzhufengensis TaxID=1164594 RepID=A0A1I1E6B0_9BURK|nr:TonB-dependent receptor [Massilia yuzhufengensis]SFB82667.1 iron complex outermembrane recepter protein [Massilia yuzhufengensis]
MNLRRQPPAGPLCLPLSRVKQAVFLLAGVLALPAQAFDSEPEDLETLSLEALANVRVTSVSRRSEAAADAAASVYVISAEAIRRSGLPTLPEVLRLAPNLQVARVDARNYAVTARGFNSAFENKLLVLIDGRSVYTPLFSGVFWDAQDVVLEDVERIEVISGAGATMWGANAVNGVINIITKAAGATQGTQLSASTQRDLHIGAVRHGGTLAGGGRYRVYAKALEQDDIARENGLENVTGYRRSQAGFRADWGQGADTSTLQGDAYQGALHQQGTRAIRIAGANLLARKSMRLQGGTDVSAQAYWDFTERNQPLAFVEHLNTLDLQVQASQVLAERHRLVWGAGYRKAYDRIENGAGFGFLPGKLDMHWGNAFVQDEIDVTDTVRVIAGAKFEHNNYTGMEFLPTLRLAWKPSGDSLAWASASRTVRAPSRIDRDFYSPTVPRVVNGVPQFAIAGGPDFRSEVANVFELGYRIQPLPGLSYSATAFLSDYERLRTLEPNPNGPGSVFSNLARGRTRGIEMWSTWEAARALRLTAGLVVQNVRTEAEAGSKDASAATGLATSDPSNYWKLQASYDIAPGHSFDALLRHYGSLSRPEVPAYESLDLNYTWRINRQVDLSVSGQNLLDAAHPEFGGGVNRAVYERSLGLKLVWRL